MESASTRGGDDLRPGVPSELLPELLGSIPDGLLLFSKSGVPCVWHNPSARKLLGLSVDEVRDLTWRRLVEQLTEKQTQLDRVFGEDLLPSEPPSELPNEPILLAGRMALHVEDAEQMRLQVIDWNLRRIGPDTDAHWLLAVRDASSLHTSQQEERRSETALRNVVSEQQSLLMMLRQLGTPVLPIHKGIVVLPLIGHIDTARADHVMEAVLAAIVRYQTQVVIIDITGVSLVDTAVANSLIQTVRAAQLLGTLSILVGISAEVARSMVHLGVRLDQMVTQRDLQAGIAYALRFTGHAIVRRKQDTDWVAAFAESSQEEPT